MASWPDRLTELINGFPIGQAKIPAQKIPAIGYILGHAGIGINADDFLKELYAALHLADYEIIESYEESFKIIGVPRIFYMDASKIHLLYENAGEIAGELVDWYWEKKKARTSANTLLIFEEE